MDARPATELRSDDLHQPGLEFAHGGAIYRTSGQALAAGGMGATWLVDRVATERGEPPLACVAKTFHSEYLYQVRGDAITRRDHLDALASLERLSRLEHPNLLPTLAATPIVDNYLTITPRKPQTLLQLVNRGETSAQRRVALLLGALRGLAGLHQSGFLHRDFTLRNILVDGDGPDHAYLFDFDLALALDTVRGHSYRTRYAGRVFGSPGYSVAPEVLDPVLMDCAITPRLDIYAVGGALFALFSDELPYGPTEDLWALLLGTAEGVVHGGVSRIVYPEAVPVVLRPVIEGCLERDPGSRYGSVTLLMRELETRLPALPREPAAAPPVRRAGMQTVRYGPDAAARVHGVYDSRRDPNVSRQLVARVDAALVRYGYQLQRCLEAVKNVPIFLVAPDPALVAAGQFSDTNTYPKIVAVLDLGGVADCEQILETWIGRYLPALRAARRGLITALHRVIYDEPSRFLLLLSEYVDDARFGPELDGQDLTLREALGLGYLVSHQVDRLHAHGLAHNNVCARSLLLKGVREAREVHPAMVGLVAPSEAPADMTSDARHLADLICGWLRPARIDAAGPWARKELQAVRARLQAIAAASAAGALPAERPVSAVIDAVGGGLATIDRNFAVLRDHDGDLGGYALLLASPALYGRLWPQ